MKRKAMTAAQQFFYEHAGSSYDPATETKEQGRRRGAIALAKAEAWAESEGFIFDWAQEECPDISWMSEDERKSEHEILCVTMLDAEGQCLQSLGNIVDADRNYGRVVAAELALEEMSERESEQQAAADVHNYCAL